METGDGRQRGREKEGTSLDRAERESASREKEQSARASRKRAEKERESTPHVNLSPDISLRQT